MQRLLRGLRHVPEQRISPESTPKRLEAHLRDFLKRRHPSPRFSPRDTRFWGVITFQEKLRTPRGRAPFSSTPPGSQHTTRAARWGDPRVGASSSQDKNVPARHGTTASGPHARRQPHALPSTPGSVAAGRDEAPTAGSAGCGGRGSAQDSPSARPPQQGGEDGLGEDTIWQRLQLLPAASSSRLWEEAATSRQRQLRWRPRQHHIPLLLASSLTLRPPPPLPWQRGAKEISPAPPSRPCLPRPLGRGAGPAPSRPLPPPTEGPGRGPGGCPERPVGKEGGGMRCPEGRGSHGR